MAYVLRLKGIVLVPANMERDSLTGLPGRRVLEGVLTEALGQAQDDGGASSVGVVDVDLFGQMNERFGEEAGDGVLRALAERLSVAFGGAGSVYRIGGDGFAVYWPGVEKEQAFLALERFRQELDMNGVLPEGGEVRISAGLASSPDDSAEAVELINKASDALYRAKVSGRDKVCLARDEKMITKTSHYTQGQLLGLRRLAEREGFGEAVLLREALNDVLRKYNA